MPEPIEVSTKKPNAIELGVVLLLVVLFLIVSMFVQNPFAEGADFTGTIGTILAAGLTLVMYSFLYRDNPFYKIAENLYVGVTMGYLSIVTWRQTLRPEVFDPLFRAPTADMFWSELAYRCVPIILGLLLITRLSRKYGWMSRYSYAVIIGWGSGFAIQTTMNSAILKQLETAVSPFQDAAAGVSKSEVLSQGWFAQNPAIAAAILVFGSIFVMVGTVAVLWYFFFSVEHKRAGGAFSKLGILFLMVSFGASFGYTVMGRVSLLIGRVQFLLFDWLRIPR